MTTSDGNGPSTATRHVSNDDDDMKIRYIAKLKDHVVEKIVRENRTTLAYDRNELTRLVEQRIATMFTDFHTPDHPTYAFMIRRAVMELNDKGRSDKEAISEFIRKEYDDLPVAHENMLTFHLNKLCEKGDILLSAVGCYFLPAGDYVQQKIRMRENKEVQVEKKSDGGGEVGLKGCDFMRNGAVDGSHEREVCSRPMNGKKRKGKEGLQIRIRWSRRLNSDKIQADEANNGGREIVTQTGENNVTCRDQKCHTELPTADHSMEEQQFEVTEDPFESPGFSSKNDQLITKKCHAELPIAHPRMENQQFETVEDPFEPPGFSSKSDKLITKKCHTELPIADHRTEDQPFEISEDPLKPPGFSSKSNQLTSNNQQAGTNLHAFRNGAEVELTQDENTEIKSDISRCRDTGNPSNDESPQHVPGPNVASEVDRKSQLQTPAPALDDSLRSNNMNADLHEVKIAEIANAVLLPGEQGKPDADDCILNLNQTTGAGLSLMREEEAASSLQCQIIVPCTDDVPDQQVLNATLDMALQDQQGLRTEMVTTPADPTPDACPTAILNSQHDDDQHPEKQDTPVRRGRPRKTSNGFSIITVKLKKKDGRGRPRKEKPDELPKPTTDVENASKKTADSRDRKVAGAKDLHQNSNSVNAYILALESQSKDKEGANTGKRIGRPYKSDEDEISETLDFPKAKKGRGSGIKKLFYTDTRITEH